MFETWLDRISSWADHDGLVHYSDRADGGGEAGASEERISLGQSRRIAGTGVPLAWR